MILDKSIKIDKVIKFGCLWIEFKLKIWSFSSPVQLKVDVNKISNGKKKKKKQIAGVGGG